MYKITDENFEYFRKHNVSFLKDNIFFRDIKYKKIQILKMISFLVRDKNWNNYNPNVSKFNLIDNDKYYKFTFDLEYGDFEKLFTTNTFYFSDENILLKSKGRYLTDFWTNRIGFNLLIPLKYHVGSELKIVKDNNIIKKSNFPDFISPDQPFYKFNKLSYNINDELLMEINFKGIKFEMEDQRNWGDASYKIYSGSLLDPFPYMEKKGSDFYQEINILYTSKKTRSKIIQNNEIEIINDKEFKMPKIGIKVDKLNECNEKFNLNFSFVYFIYDTSDNNIDFDTTLCNKPVFLVALVDYKNEPKFELSKIDNFIKKNNINLDKILICPKVYLGSFQPSGAWPNVPNLNIYYNLAKEKFSNSEIVSGMVTNFTELNRKRPENYFDVVNFSFTPIVHDASDFGVLDTLETIPYILNSINKISKKIPIHVGPITLAMHYNPYGESLVNNINNTPLEMSNKDPRHDTIFGLNWTTSIFIQLIDTSTKYLTFNSFYGPNGIISQNKEKQRPLFYLNELLIYFKNFKIKKIKSFAKIYSIYLYNENSKYLLIANSSKSISKIKLSNFIIKKISKLNINNYYKLLDNNTFSFLDLKEYDYDDNMQALEIRLMEVE